MRRVVRWGLIGLAGLVVGLGVLWLFLRRPDIPYAELDRRWASPASKWMDLPGGLRVHYRDEGKADGPALVMVHGFSASLHAWEPWVARLGDRYRIISLDLPGHGLTEAPSDWHGSLDAFADVVDAVALKLNAPRYVVIGNSMGGGTAWDDAVRHADHVRALVLVDAVPVPGAFDQTARSNRNGPLVFKLLANPVTRAVMGQIDIRPLAEKGLKSAYYDQSLVTPHLVDRYVDLSRAPGHRMILIGLQGGGRPAVTPADIAAIKVPTLVMHGENDALIPVAAGRKTAAAIPGAHLVLYPAVGHVPMEQIPDRSAADLAAFLSTLPPDSAADR